MAIIRMPGGWSKVEYDDNVGFATPTEIPAIIKDQTTIEFDTPTIEMADGNDAPTGKKLTISIRSGDMTSGVWTELIAAEAALTKMFFKFTSLDAAKYIILKSVIPRVEPVSTPAGDLNGYRVKGTGFKVTPSDLYAITVT
jgi:hypothetical protein